jgi:TonB family protein
MILSAEIKKINFLLSIIDEKHPYLIPLFISLVMSALILFYTSPIYIADMDISSDTLEFVNLESVSTPARVVKHDVSAVTGESEASVTERAIGTADQESPVDISFYPNIAVPKPVGRLKKIYPKSAREQDINATVNVEILIAPDGVVRKVNVLAVRISKALPTELNRKISNDFSSAAVQILLGAQFSPPIVNGKRVPIKMELPLNFRMDEI